jgi:hypothetical protein
MMFHTHQSLTLQASLEALLLLSAGALISSTGEEWTAQELLDWLQTTHPTRLELPVSPFATRPHPHWGHLSGRCQRSRPFHCSPLPR